MMNAIPLTVLPLVAYNLVGYSLSGADPWATALFALPMPSGARWSLHLGDLLITFAIAMLYCEVMRSAAVPRGAVANRILSTIVLIVYMGEFAAVGVAADSVFFILTVIALFDVAAGFSIRAARREATRNGKFDGDEEIGEPV